jgi:translocation and assembly module TamB
MGGTLHIGGTSLDPQITGGFDMRRGTIDVAGASLTFSSGKVSFTGTGIKNKIDPTLDFTAQTTSGGYTATLTISGYADAPKIGLTAVPELPQDEVLARLIFSQGVTQLSALQAAQIGAALASMSGLGGNSLDPLASVQKKLRLDRLSISGGTGGTGPEANTGASVTAGRYVSNRVYVGAKQSTTGNTQAQVQIDLSKHLKFQTTLATGTTTVQGATVDNDPGSSVGLAYQIDY